MLFTHQTLLVMHEYECEGCTASCLYVCTSARKCPFLLQPQSKWLRCCNHAITRQECNCRDVSFMQATRKGHLPEIRESSTCTRPAADAKQQPVARSRGCWREGQAHVMRGLQVSRGAQTLNASHSIRSSAKAAGAAGPDVRCVWDSVQGQWCHRSKLSARADQHCYVTLPEACQLGEDEQ